ncbi:MAG: SPFH domain-containing protein [Methylacidiphilales bacterium]|nr:SPFH domain-containing protein [Candidatus Methylacidiphilales bacterium]
MLFFSVAVVLLVVVYFFMGVRIVPQSQNYLVERLGKYSRTLDAGLHFIVPFIEIVSKQVNILERQLPTNQVTAITKDNVNIGISLAVLYRVTDPAKTMYRIQNVDQAITTTVTGTVRSVIGRTEFDGVQSNRRELSDVIETELTAVCIEWGIVLSRVEIIDVDVDESTRNSMQLQLNAERTRRATVTEAEGKKQAAILQADAAYYAAQRDADGKRVLAEAESYSISIIAKAIAQDGEQAVQFQLKKIHTDALSTIGKSTNAKFIILPTDVLESVESAFKKISGK